MTRYALIPGQEAPLMNLSDSDCGAVLSAVDILHTPTVPAPPMPFPEFDIDVELELVEDEAIEGGETGERDEITVRVGPEELRQLIARAFAA